MGPQRIGLGAGVALAGLAACTLLLAPHRNAVSLAGVALLYLIPVYNGAAFIHQTLASADDYEERTGKPAKRVRLVAPFLPPH